MIDLIKDESALEIGLKALDDFPCSFEILSEYETWMLRNKDIPVGAVFYKGPEVHIAILKKYRRRWASRRLIKKILNIPFRQYGYAVTMGFDKDRDFLERIGFEEEFNINEVTYYRIEP